MVTSRLDSTVIVELFVLHLLLFYIVKRFAGKKRVSGEDHLNGMKNIILIIAFTDKTVSTSLYRSASIKAF